MKTQSIFNYVVTENVNVKDAATGQIEKVEKKILGQGTIAAYTPENAKVQAQQKAKTTGADMAEVEVLIAPFCG